MEGSAGPEGPSETLAEVLAELEGAESLQAVQAVLRSSPRRLVGAKGATFVLREGQRCFYADEDPVSPLWKGQRFPIEECISGWCMLHDEVAAIPDISLDERIPQEAYRPTFVRSLVMVPIGSPPFAAMGAYWASVRTAAASELETLRALAAAAATAVERIGLDDAPYAPVFRRS